KESVATTARVAVSSHRSSTSTNPRRSLIGSARATATWSRTGFSSMSGETASVHRSVSSTWRSTHSAGTAIPTMPRPSRTRRAETSPRSAATRSAGERAAEDLPGQQGLRDEAQHDVDGLPEEVVGPLAPRPILQPLVEGEDVEEDEERDDDRVDERSE